MNNPDFLGTKKLNRDLEFSARQMREGLSSFPDSRSTSVKRDAKRIFSTTVKNQILMLQKRRCARCRSILRLTSTHYDHKLPWKDGGRTDESNCQALCANCHGDKTHEDRLKRERKNRIPQKESQNPNRLFDINSNIIKRRKSVKRDSSVLGGNWRFRF